MEKKTFIEVERKWLLKNTPNLTPDKIINIIQFYTEGNIRYRREKSSDEKQEFFYKIEKQPIGEGKSLETVEEISLKEFWTATQNCPYMIRKKRHVYKQDGFNIEIDAFHNIQLILMEIEVDALEDEIKIPKEIKKYIIKEVTGDADFSNKHLSGFC